MSMKPLERGELRKAAVRAAGAVTCLILCWLAMVADARYVRNPAGTDLAAVIFIPLALSFVASLLLLANLGACVLIRYRTQLTRRDLGRPDYALIAEIEREIYGEAFRHDGAPEPARARPGPCRCDSGKTTLDGSHAPGRPAGPGKRGSIALPGLTAAAIPGSCAWCHGPLTERWSCGRGSTNTTFTNGNMSLAAMGGGGGGSSYPQGDGQSWTCCSQEHMRLLMEREGF